MASPTPEDPKARDPVEEKEQKPEVNGHATPKDDAEKPTVNGTKEHHTETNGVAKDVEMENADASKPTNEGETNDAKKQSTETEESKPTEDVEMTDATTPVEKPDAPTKQEPTDDAEMSDKPAEKVNGTSEAPAPSSDDIQPASLSQLAIESNESGSTPKPSIEVNMEDAPVKVAREREDDNVDEPAPKRAKTEPSEDDFGSTVAVASSAPAEAPTQQNDPFARLEKWNNAEFNSQKITPYQRREIRKVLGRVKKTKQGGHFRDSVQRLWPGLWESYLAKIEKPTDLSEIDRNVRDPSGPYVTMDQFRKDLILMYENTLAFNGAIHDVTNAAKGSIRSIWDDIVTIPQEEPVKPKPAPKQKAPRESRTATQVEPISTVRKPSAGPKPSPAAEPAAPKPAPKPPVAQSQASAGSDARRDSSATEGDRPKRTVRAPKPKDIDYSTKPSRKKLKPELQFAEEVLSELMAPKNKHLNSWFMEAVDAEGLNIPTYYSVIKRPMHLAKVSTLMANGDITSFKDFDKIVRLIFTNCYTFNGPVEQGNAVSYVASQLEDFYNQQVKGKDAWLAKHAKANAPPPASHPSDDEEEEEEPEDAAAAGVDPAVEVRDLEAKLREETNKVNDLFAAETPNQSLIMVQQGIVTMVQEALLKAKTALSEYRQKHDSKPSKKSSKPSKPKSSSSSAPRKPAGNVPPKKSGATKKAASKRNLNAAEKDAIANAINDLEYPHLDRAIEIIKRDTGQNENNDGELELDIDQLSNDALLKLWELCKKVLPAFGKDLAGPATPEVTRAAPAKQSKSAGGKPKKNKPMSAREQEERIAQLKGLRDMYKSGNDGPDAQNVTQAPTPTAESSDDSDSEEE